MSRSIFLLFWLMLVLLSGLNNIERGPSSGNSLYINIMQCKDNFANSVPTQAVLLSSSGNLLFSVSQHKSTHTQSTGWQTNPDTNNSKNIWHWLTGKSFEERGDMLLLWKPGKSENRKKQLRLTLASSRKIFFSCEEAALEVLITPFH